MNKFSSKITILVLCVVLCLGGAVSVFALTTDKKDVSESSQNTASSETADGNIAKDETVYVLAGADGAVKKIIVSDWIKNALGSANINDSSNLSNIENVKGDESYKISGNAKVWDANGKDIYYQGNIEKELPVGLSITYKLDGETVSADNIAGKSGKVSIRFDYDNKQFETVKINGKDEKIYVPFAMLTGMILDSNDFRNVQVSNGKLLNDGDRTAVVGIAMPGLQDNLGISKDKFELPDYVEITADVTNFNMGMTVTVATNEIFTKLDTSKLDSADGITDSITQLSDGMKQLLDGSSQLYDGLYTLLDKSKELVQGIDKLAVGAKSLSDGAVALDNGIGKLKSGTNDLSNGLNKLKSNNDTLNGGAKQVFESLLATAEKQIKASGIDVPTLTIDNYAKVLDEIIGSLDETKVYEEALRQVTAAVESNRPLIIQKVTETVREQVKAQVTNTVRENVLNMVTASVKEQVSEQVIQKALGMSKADYDAAVKAGMIPTETQNIINSSIDTQMQTSEVKSTIEANTSAQMESDTIKSTIKSNTDAQMETESVKNIISENVENQIKKAIAENMASDEVQAKLAAASEGAKALIELKASLDSYNAFYLGLLTYTQGVATAADGASALNSGVDELKKGSAQLKDGASALYDGILQMKNGSPALVDGVSKLKDGSMQLSSGLKEFNEKGIEKITSLVDDAKVVIERLKATVEVSKRYRNFSGISSEMSGQVKFIYKTDEIKTK